MKVRDLLNGTFRVISAVLRSATGTGRRTGTAALAFVLPWFREHGGIPTRAESAALLSRDSGQNPTLAAPCW
jgi:hypothetical protein